MEPWERQAKIKYEHHDLTVDELTVKNIETIKDFAINYLANTKETVPQRALLQAFLLFLTKNNFRISRVPHE